MLDLRRKRAEEEEEMRREMERMQAERQFQQAGTSLNMGSRGLQPGKQIDGATTANSSAGFLYHRDPIRVQEGRFGFIQRWGERPAGSQLATPRSGFCHCRC